MKFDVVIAGAGVLGLSLAYHLAVKRQHVLVIEREPMIGMHASGKNAGMFRQLYGDEQLTDWAERSFVLWPAALRDRCFDQTGSIIFGTEDPRHHRHLFQRRTIRVTGQERTRTTSAVYTETDGLLDSPMYMTALFSLCREHDVHLRLSEQICALENSKAGWRGETSSGFRFEAPWLVNACGAWAGFAFEQLFPARSLSVQPYARHLFLIEGWPESFMPARDCGFYWNEIDHWYLRRWSKSARLFSLGDTTPADPDRFTPGPQLEEQLAILLLAALPEVAPNLYVSRSWHCFRTYTADQLPLVGEDPSLPGLFWLAAFGGFGMSVSFAATYDAAGYLTGRRESLPYFAARACERNEN